MSAFHFSYLPGVIHGKVDIEFVDVEFEGQTWIQQVGRSEKVTQADLGALRSGELSDCQITCDDRTWNLHGVYFCTRSPYFEKAFTEKALPSEDRKVSRTITALLL